MTARDRTPPDEGVRHVEPEIIPPDRFHRRRTPDGAAVWASFGAADGGRIYLAKPSLLSLVIAALTLGVALAVVLAFFLGAFLIVLPAIGLIIGALALTGIARAAFRRRL